MVFRNRPIFYLFLLAVFGVVACGDDDTPAKDDPDQPAVFGRWICYDYGGECLCHASKGNESPSTSAPIVDACEYFTCCVNYRDDYGLRCDCANIGTDCQLKADEKENGTVVDVCPAQD
ncbi:MAG: hypothetical protein JXA30_17450 [Deltaproteobacteria bacterium]|nr:hypothetical protein [Deltaproteobacteria bacterium]